MEVTPLYDSERTLLNYEEWNKAPFIGVFSISEYGTANSFPYGAMVVRNNK